MTNRPVRTSSAVTLDAEPEILWQRIQPDARVRSREVSLTDAAVGDAFAAYWGRFADRYRGIGREKALEHAMTFVLIDFAHVSKYCDIASATSPLHDIVSILYPRVEFWRQDLLYTTDLERHTVGGFAQEMRDVPDGFFDAMTLHCSYEHFTGDGDIAFLREVNRVLADGGACLIVPLYLANTHRVYFDPTEVAAHDPTSYDAEGELIAVRGYRQSHGRAHSPETLTSRLLSALPASLHATLLRFRDLEPGMYLEFGLFLQK